MRKYYNYKSGQTYIRLCVYKYVFIHAYVNMYVYMNMYLDIC